MRVSVEGWPAACDQAAAGEGEAGEGEDGEGEHQAGGEQRDARGVHAVGEDRGVKALVGEPLVGVGEAGGEVVGEGGEDGEAGLPGRVLALFERQAISFFYGARPDDEGVQNIPTGLAQPPINPRPSSALR